MLWNGWLGLPTSTLSNLWGDLERDEYADFMQYEYEEQLTDAINANWERIPTSQLKKSMRVNAEPHDVRY